MLENLNFLSENIKEPYKIRVSEPERRQAVKLSSILSIQTLYLSPDIDHTDFEAILN